MTYRVTTPKGEKKLLPAHLIERFLVEVNGGGLSVEQTMNAMEDGHRLAKGETVTRNGWTICKKEP